MNDFPFRASFWAEDESPEQTPPLDGQTKADVVVIGAGIVGLSCAYELRKEGLDVVLLERDHVGFGSSARNFGIMTPTLGPWIGQWGGFYSSDVWTTLHAWLHARVDEAERLLAAEQIECEFKRRPMWFVALNESDADELKRNVERHSNMGTPARFVAAKDMKEITTFEVFGGMALEGGAAVHPWHLVRGYRRLVLREGVRLFEGTPAESFESASQVVVRTPKGEVIAEKAVLALNAFSGQFGFMYKHILPKYSYALATEPLEEETAAAVGLPDDDLILDFPSQGRRASFYQRFRADGRFMCGGAGAALRVVQAFGENKLAPNQGHGPVVAQLHAEMVRRYPVLADVPVQAVWGGGECSTSTLLPIFAEESEQRDVIVAIVGNGRGMMGVGAGHLVKGLVLGRQGLDEPTRAFLDICAGPQDADPRILEAAGRVRAFSSIRQG